VVTITVTCYSWAPSSGDHLFTCGVIPPPQHPDLQDRILLNYTRIENAHKVRK